MFEGFKKFILRGNVVDLAVGVIIGAAFSKIVSSLVEDVITPIIGLVVGKPNFSGISIGAHQALDKAGKPSFNELGQPILEGGIMIGNFLNALISFLLVAGAVYFLIVVPLNRLMALMIVKQEPAPVPPTKDQLLLEEIRDLLKAK